jgi:hypothetical protein
LFAVELLFNDGVSPDELIVVRRQSFVLGSIQDADVILEGTSGAISPIRIERRRGRRFAAIPLEDDSSPQIFNGEGELTVGEITLKVIPLDLDLVIAASKQLEFAPAKVLSRALCNQPPEYPALEIIGATNSIVSFPDDQELLIGKSRNCAVRLDEEGIFPEHVKVGCNAENNLLHEFWIEPCPGAHSYLESNASIEHRSDIGAGQLVVLSPGKCSIRLLRKDEGISEKVERNRKSSAVISRYPCVVSRSELMKPDRYPLSIGRKVSLGRDPSNEIWFNASHVSRLHAELLLDLDPNSGGKNSVSITDYSSNGTFIDGARLNTEAKRTLPDKMTVVDLSRGVTFAICFNAEEEEEYLGRKPAPPKRASSLHGQILSQIQIPMTPFNSDEDFSNNSEQPAWFASSQLKSAETNNSTAQPEAFTPFASSDSTGISSGFSQRGNFPPPQEAESENVEYEVTPEEFAPQKRFGLVGKLTFYICLVFLVVFNYFVYFGR